MYFHYPTLFKILNLTFSRKYFSPRHALISILFITLFLILRTIVCIVRLLDNVFFPGYRKQPLTHPIYIIGNPRSGTTFTHRLISQDKQFSYFRLYQTIFPAVTFYKLFATIEKLDSRLGGPSARLLSRISRKGFEGWKKIHKTELNDAESDEMLFIYAMLSPLLGLLFPFFAELDGVKFVDSLPAKKRLKLMGYYKDCLQRHMFATGPDKVLLQKVALIAGRLDSIIEVLPDMHIVHLIRHPYQSIPSLVSMFYVPWKKMAPQAIRNSQASLEVAKMIFEYYRYLLELKKRLPKGKIIEIYYEDLIHDQKGTVEKLYRHLGLEMSDEFRTVLEGETEKARCYKSTHKYSLEDFGLTKKIVYRELKEVFEHYGFER